MVRNEFEMGENSAERVLSQRMVAAAFEWHNYGKSTIGNRTDIERVPVDNLQAFYKKYYRPDNALLIVAGAFDATKALALAAKHFGALKNPDEQDAAHLHRGAAAGRRAASHPPPRREGPGPTGVVYHLPAASHPDFPACEVLEETLTAAPSGRVYKALVEAKLASGVSGNAFALHDPGFVEITATTEPANTEKARDALVATLEKLADAPLTKDEVERAKTALLKSREQVLTNSQRFAVNLSEWAAAGDWRLFFLHRDRTEKVTADDVNRAAKKYLVQSNRTVGVYIPTDKPERAEVPGTPDVAALVGGYKGREAVASGEAFDPTPDNVEKRVKRGAFAGGLKYALLSKKTRGETVVLTLNLRAGNAESLAGKNAAFDFLGPMLLRGTSKHTRQELKDAFDKLKATVSISTDGDRAIGLVAVSVQTKRDNLPAVLALLAEVLREPTFPEKEFEVLKKEEVDALEKGKTEPQALAMNALQRAMSKYPKTDVRYVPTLDESAERLKATTVADVKALYAEQVGGTAGELAVVGDFDADAAVGGVEAVLKGWAAKVPYKRIDRPHQPTKAEQVDINTPDKANAFYIAAHTLEAKDSDPEYAGLVVGNYLLGASPLSSRLSNRVRGKDGLSYMVMSQAAAGPLDKNGVFLTVAITNPKNVGKVDAAMTEEVAKFLKEGVSASELEEGKKAWLAAQKQGRASDAALAGQLAGGLFAGRTMAYYSDLEKQVEGLEPADVAKAFGKLVDPKKMVVIKAGDLSKKDDKEEKK